MKYEQFDIPTQVLFWDDDNEHWTAGIAYGEIIICGCCGGIFELKEVNEFAPAEISNPVIPMKWTDISVEIIREEIPSEIFQKNSEISAKFVDEED